jgi:hypothetical protein
MKSKKTLEKVSAQGSRGRYLRVGEEASRIFWARIFETSGGGWLKRPHSGFKGSVQRPG